MSDFTILTPSEQVAAHLRQEIFRGRWSITMPGVPAIATKLNIDPKTAGLALHILEAEGLILGQGPGRSRRITLPKNTATPTLRIAILTYESRDRIQDYMIDLRHMLEEAGHIVIFASKSMKELGMDLKRISRQVSTCAADAWVLIAAPRHIIEWFAIQSFPAFALFGRRRRVRIAGTGPDHTPSMQAAAQRLLELGHQRIVLLIRQEDQEVSPRPGERAVLEEIEKYGYPTSSYNFPKWENTPAGLRRLLDELFRFTPPTALIIDEAFIFHAVKEHLAHKGILAPKQISLICIDGDPSFEWCEPSVAHIAWDSSPWSRSIVSWVNNVSRGKEDLNQTLTITKFIDGGTVGPPPQC